MMIRVLVYCRETSQIRRARVWCSGKFGEAFESKKTAS